MKIMIINSNSSQEMTDADAVAARSSAQAGTKIVAVTPEYAPASIESFYDEYLGCASFAEFADSLEAKLGIPVLDGVVCATKMAESIIDMGRKTSKIKTYKFPEGKAFTGIMATFGNETQASDVAAE